MSGINLDKIKKKKKKLEGNGGGNSGNVRWKPDMNTKHRIRMLLPDDGTGDPFKEFHIHYQVGNSRPFLCASRNFNNDCPVCDFASELYQQGKELDSSSHKELAKDLWPSERYYSPVIEIDKNSREVKEGPAWYGHSKTVQKDFVDYMLDDEYNFFTNEQDGHDIKLEKTKGENDRFPSTKIDLAPMPCPIVDDQEEIDRIISEIPDIDKVVSTLPEEEVKEALDEHMREVEGVKEDMDKYGGDDEEEDSSDGASVEEAFGEIKGIGSQ